MSQYLAIKKRREAASVDLRGHMEICELNYHRCLRLLPGLRDEETEWHYLAGGQNPISVDIRCTEKTPYTSLVTISQACKDMSLPTMQLRLYHDADVAEVIVFEGHRYWQPQYDYPNPKMYAPDEKFELNRFLRDWLVFCHNHGLMKAKLCESVHITRRT
ncbi:DUF1249 domain-containing protein [Agaribacterium sp. ZY112]|uniref:DUF1249 domain-containing protein n=1 Tax=Agaribacterium sp. ZY112 TaxID=3233574 RepID=UPI003524E3B2